MRFRDRGHAGRELAQSLMADVSVRSGAFDRPVVLAIPRGGLPIGYEIAQALEAPLDVLVVRRFGAPGTPDRTIAAVAEQGGVALHLDHLLDSELAGAELDRLLDIEAREVRRRLNVYRGKRPMVPIKGRTVILADDGTDTGTTLLAAVDAARRAGARRILLAVPVTHAALYAELSRVADQVFCARVTEEREPEQRAYEQFPRLDDLEMLVLLDRAAHLQEKTSR